jgi:hypothetical protein
MMNPRSARSLGIGRSLTLAAALLCAGVSTLSAQVPCSGNAGGLNERRFSVTPADVSAGPAQITAMTFDNGSVVLTQQVQVAVELLQQTHLVSLCLHADYAAPAGSRAIGTGDLEWRRVSPDPMTNFVAVSRSTPAPVIAQQAVGTLTAVFEFRMRLRWNTHVPATWATGLVWSAYRNN